MITRRTQIAFVAFSATQLLDAGLTLAGVSLGLASEANPLILSLSQTTGLLSALAMVKCVAILLGAGLALNGRTMLLAFLTLFYWALAILPWMLILGWVRF